MVVNKITIGFLFLATSLTMIGCQRTEQEFGDLIKLAGSNKPEVTKLVSFYQSEQNAERKKMFEYLLKTLGSQKSIKFSVLQADGTLRRLNTPISVDSMENIRRQLDSSIQIDTVLVIRTIKADFLISHVKKLSRMRAEYKWIENIPFDVFLNYVLPFRVNNEPIYNYNHLYSNRYLPYINDVIASSKDPEMILENYLNPFFESRKGVNSHIDFSSELNLKTLKNMRDPSADLEDNAVLHVHALRTLGIPCTYEYAPHLDNSNHGTIIVSPMNSHNPQFSPVITRSIYKFRVAKFYRNMYDAQDSDNPYTQLLKLGIPSNEIPFSLNIPRSKDVTSQKTIALDVLLDIDSNLAENQVLYLAAMDNVGAKIVSWAKVNKKRGLVRFKNMGTYIRYSLATYANGYTVLRGSPFLIDSLGNYLR